MHSGNKVAVILGVLFWILSSGNLPAADVAKIGVVDIQRILENSNPGKAAQSELKKQKDQMENDLKKKGGEIEELRNRLERESMVMSQETREEKEREARILMNDFKTLQKRYRSDLQALERKLMGELQKNIIELVSEMGKREGYLLIVSKIGVLYSPQSIDVTDELIKQLNLRSAQ
jgi:outer membrane protein